MGVGLSKASVKNTVEEITDIITNVIISNASTCGVTSVINQEVLLGNVGGNVSGIDFNAQIVVNLDCLQSATNDAAIQNDIALKLSQFAKSKAETGLVIGILSKSQSESENISRLVTKISNNIKIDNVKKCVSSIIINQKLQTGDVVGDVSSISLNVSSSTIAKCVQTDTSVSSSITELATEIEQSGEANALAGLSSAALLGMLFIVVIVIIILAILFR